MTHPLLFTPITIRGVTARNRVMVSPVTNRRRDACGGGPTGRMRFALEVTYAHRLRQREATLRLNRAVVEGRLSGDALALVASSRASG